MKQSLSEKQYIQLAIDQFCRVINQAPFISDTEVQTNDHLSSSTSPDFSVYAHIQQRGETIKFNIEVKSSGEKRFARAFADLVAMQNAKSNWVFMAPYISAETGEFLKAQNLNFMDLSGNCYISAWYLFISVSGQPNQYIERRDKKAYFSKSSSGASSVIRTMLRTPTKWWQVKELAEKSGKAMGTVSNVKSYLLDHDWLEEKNGRFRACHIKELLQAWAKDYHSKGSLSYQFYSLDPIPEIEKMVAQWSNSHEGAAQLSSFSAGARYAPVVRYTKANLYVQPQYLAEIRRDLNLQEVESGGNVMITIPHDQTPYIDTRIINGDPIVSPVQAILDLLGESSRGEEAAEAIIYKEFGDQ